MDFKNQRDNNSVAEKSEKIISQGCDEHPHKQNSLPPAFMHIIELAISATDIEVLRIDQVSKKTGQGASTLWLGCKIGTFPPPIKLSQRSVAWIKAEVNAVLAARILASRTGYHVDMKRFVALLIQLRAPT